MEVQKRLLILGSLGEFVELVKLAGSRGYYTVVCDGYPDGPAKAFADRSYDIDVREVDAIAEICRTERIDAITGSFSDLLFEQITLIAAKAGLKWYATPEMIPFYREKNVTKRILSELGVSVPRNVTLRKDFTDSELAELRFPLVVKPVNAYGSRGLYVVRSAGEIREHFDEIVGYSAIKRVQAEEYSPGREYNMMSWVREGKVNVISIADREKNPQEGSAIPLLNRVAYPAKNIRGILDEARDVLQRFADYTGQRDGALSMQFFYNDNGVEVCEIAGRFFGYEHEMATFCGGLSFEELLLNYAFEPERIEEQFCGYSPLFDTCYAGLYLMGEEGKVVSDDSALRALAADPHVREAVFFYAPGERIVYGGPKPYLARFYLTAPSREELDAVTERFFAAAHVAAADGTELVRRAVMER